MTGFLKGILFPACMWLWVQFPVLAEEKQSTLEECKACLSLPQDSVDVLFVEKCGGRWQYQQIDLEMGMAKKASCCLSQAHENTERARISL